MQILRQQLKQTLTAVLFGAMCLIQIPVLAETAEANNHNTQHATTSHEWPGVYFGMLPCADCDGVKTSLALNANNSYILITQYIGKSLKEFVEKGKYAATDKSNVIALTPKNSSTSRQYLVGTKHSLNSLAMVNRSPAI